MPSKTIKVTFEMTRGDYRRVKNKAELYVLSLNDFIKFLAVNYKIDKKQIIFLER